MRFNIPLRSAAAILLCCSLASCSAQGQTRYAFEDEADKGPWQEAEVQLPALPDPANLLKLQVEAAATHRFAVDSKSITIGSDGVVRYTIVGTSPAGATTISHEGIRCAAFEAKVYAYGHKDGTWAPARRKNWERIVRGARNGYQDTLALDFFCEGLVQVGTVPEIVKRIRENQVLNPRIQY